MKKIYTTLFCLLLTTILLAQTTITSSWAPTGSFGSNITVTSNTTAHNPGASGANCIWNLTSWSAPTNFNVTDTCSFSINLTDYPGTTDLIKEYQSTGTYYRFHKLAGNVYKNLGYDIEFTPSGDYDHYVYNTPIDVLHFPINYNNQFITNGHYIRQWSSGLNTYVSHGGVMALVTIDGYGKLNTPMGSFVNVLRVHTQENYIDSIGVAFQTWNITNLTADRYDWIAADRPGIILASTSTFNNVYGTTYYSYYSHVTPTLTGIEELPKPQLVISVFPQPASNQTTVNIIVSKAGQATFIISDMQGKVIIRRTSLLQAGNNEIAIDLKDFSNGMYVLTVSCDEQLRTEKMVVLKP